MSQDPYYREKLDRDAALLEVLFILCGGIVLACVLWFLGSAAIGFIHYLRRFQ